MNYFLFLNHPHGEKIYKMTKSKEKLARKYFKAIDTFETEVEIRGKKYRALVDKEAFNQPSNFDCFNCQEPCCADNPARYENQTRELIISNLERYNEMTKNVDILLEMGYSLEEVKESIAEDELMAPEEHIEEEITLCTCSFKPKNGTTLCSIHALCLEKGLGMKEIVEHKPVICSLWPIEILAEDDNSLLYITLPNDFTNRFTIEDYYSNPCINIDFSESAMFRRYNPDGFDYEEYKPLKEAYKETLIYGLGEQFYNDLLKN
jgi:hypothetical protein